MDECCDLDDWVCCTVHSAPVRGPCVKWVMAPEVAAITFVESAYHGLMSLMLGSIQANAPPVMYG